MLARREWLAALAAAPAAAALARPALAQAWPSRPVRIVVPFAAGGGTDVLARILANGLSERLGGNVVVENRTGAGGNLALENVIRASADGYSLLMGTNGAVAVNRHLYHNLGFDPLKDLVPISLAFRIEHLLAVSTALPAHSVAELIGLAKAQPGRLTFGSAGTGSMIHLAGELFRLKAGIDITHVPYRGGGPAMNDLVAGTIDMMFDSLPSAEPQVRGGRVRALALCGTGRHPLLPELPTMVEAGLPGYAAASTGGLFAPQGTPSTVVDRVARAVADLVASSVFREQMARSGGDAVAAGPAELAAMMARESEQWGTVVREAKISA
ncbi:Bug family tripartite tricarboxylate transporter substrate binding protein [Muricoccus pecuniae]|uniref:Tripartite-type tricarboxylate transporter receptor subunit TctC n=1 Tax=Muricoccus pecuniae TaxID=693023 RepID=A0A840Y2T8_9PROT|nr:tripartite tricarboxylate transporter substrate binding protein [Roseomonas pecuniae]MBB5695418.1 tripartite-type tricarboxylate transporter receptor subunit TctC [Roseomonas pecuniae]